MADQTPPSLSKGEVLKVLRAAGAKGLTVHSRAQPTMRTLGYDVRDVNEWVSDCHIDEIVKHELDYEYPNRNDYIVELQIDVEGEPLPFYVKIKLPLPSMETGVVLSFHL